MGNAVDEHDVIRHPPFGDLAVHEFQNVLARRARALLELHDQKRTLVPFRMMDADHGCFRDRRMSDREIFQFDRGNPLAAGLDHVLGTVRDAHITVRIDGGDVAGIEIAFIVQNVAIDAEIGLRHRRPAHFQSAEGLAVPRQFLAGIVGDLHLHAERRIALGLQDIEPLLAGELGERRLQRGKRADRAHFGHAPGVPHAHAHVDERLDHRARHRRAAAHHAFQVRQLQIVGGHVVEQHQPHRRHAGGMRHLLGVQKLKDRRAVELGAGKYQLGSHRRRRERDAPAIGVEQRHHRQHGIAGIGAQRIAGVSHQRVQHIGAVRIQYALGIAGRARGVAHRGRGILVKGLPLELAVG